MTGARVTDIAQVGPVQSRAADDGGAFVFD